MTEREWLEGTDPDEMLKTLGEERGPFLKSSRRAILFNCALLAADLAVPG